MLEPEHKSGRNLFQIPKAEDRFFDFLHLQDCRTVDVQEMEHPIFVRAWYAKKPTVCKKCGSDKLAKGAAIDWLIWDAPRFGWRPTLIQLYVPTSWCPSCKVIVESRPPWLDYQRLSTDPKRESWRPSRTSRLIEFILDRVANFATFDEIALATCKTPSAIRTLFMRHFVAWDEAREKKLPVDVGIDEAWKMVDGKRRYITLIVDSSGTQGVIDILKDVSPITVWRRL